MVYLKLLRLVHGNSVAIAPCQGRNTKITKPYLSLIFKTVCERPLEISVKKSYFYTITFTRYYMFYYNLKTNCLRFF